MSLEEREVQRYYQPWLAAHGSSLNVAKHVESIAQLDLHRQGYVPKTSRDKALTAFAQLLAHRLDVRRTIISLIDPNTQYILCEATQTSSINASTEAADSKDKLWLGSSIIARQDAMCEYCFINTAKGLETDGSGKVFAIKGIVVHDCRKDDRFKNVDYVQREPGVRFYAGVPLYSRNGHMIGACAVSDEKPRENGLTADELRLMQDTAQSVMEHLDWARDRVDRFKGERIVRGMASFIEDCASLRDGNVVAEEAEKSQQSSPVDARQETDPRGGPPVRPRMIHRRSARRVPKSSSRSRAEDDETRMFLRAADILRDSTLADGAAIFGATASHDKKAKLISPEGLGGMIDGHARVSSELQPSPRASSDSDRHDTTASASDSDSAPLARPCKILAFSIADEQAKCEIENGTALTLGTLEKYFSMFPHGRAFSFTTAGAGVSSEDESASDREPPEPEASGPTQRRRKRRMDHRELLHKIPGAKNVIFLPLYDNAEEKLIAGCFLWTSVTGRMISLDADLSYLRAFGNCIVSEVIRMNMQRNEAAKTTFIASMSHELRSPLHGILGAAEFLMDTATDAYQSGLLTSIVTCGRTLLDTLNHVLDYSKINKLGRAQMRKHVKQNKAINLTSDSSLESLNMVTEVDLGVLVEEVAEAITAGHSFKRLPGGTMMASTKTSTRSDTSIDTLTTDRTNTITGMHGQDSDSGRDDPYTSRGVCVLLDISPRRSWYVRVQPGGLRRIIMNLLGNALKYTSSGFVAISLRAQETTDSSKVKALIRVVDSGKGMSESFQRNRAFLPFSQEDPFQPGTGLGLSIVKQIVDSLGGEIELTSQQDVGTEVTVRLSLSPAQDQATQRPDQEIMEVVEKTKGMHLVLLNPSIPGTARSIRGMTHHISRLEQTLREICQGWFGMKVTRASAMDVAAADLYLICEPPPMHDLVHFCRQTGGSARQHVPMILVCMNDEDAIAISRDQSTKLRELSRIVEVFPQPCGPRKLAKVFNHCLRRVEELKQESSGPGADSEQAISPLSPLIQEPQPGESLDKSLSTAVSYPSPPPIDPETPSIQSALDQRLSLPVANTLKPPSSTASSSQPNSQAASRVQSPEPTFHILLVDDNRINRQLLVMFMKKNKFSYLEAENGQEALDLYKASCQLHINSLSDTAESKNAENVRPPNMRKDSHMPRRFDFVLMDISMPIMDGMEATRKIREFEAEIGLTSKDNSDGQGRCKVIALTGLASAQAQQEASTAGVDLFLPKPVKFAELRGVLMAQS